MTEQILFKFKEYVQLWKTGGIAPNTNWPMIQYNTKVYKGANNNIDFVVRNNDRQPVNLVGYTLEALIQRVEHPEILLIKQVYPTDDRSGKARLILESTDINIWQPGYYRYSIRTTDANGIQEYLYTNVDRSTINNFQLIEGMEVSLSPAVEILENQFTPYPFGWYDNTWTTGALNGSANIDRINGMNTVVAYTTRFIGRFWIQASISNSTPDETDWFDIQLTPTTNYFEYSWEHSPPIKVFNFTGNYKWVRMFYHKGLYIHTQPFAPNFYDPDPGPYWREEIKQDRDQYLYAPHREGSTVEPFYQHHHGNEFYDNIRYPIGYAPHSERGRHAPFWKFEDGRFDKLLYKN